MTSSPEKLSVILLLYGRIEWSRRWLGFYDHLRFPHPILVADGSTPEDAQLIQRYLRAGRFPNLKIRYEAYPEDRNYSFYYAKLVDALAKIESPYVVIASNDDFHSPSTLHAAVRFLDENEDYVACGGASQGFSVFSKSSRPERRAVFGDTVLERPVHYRVVDQARPIDRIESHFAHYAPTFYDVHRRDPLAESFAALKSADPKNMVVAELLTSMHTAAQGKMNRLERLFLFRQRNTPDSAMQGVTRAGDAFDRMLLSSWSQDFTRLVESVSGRAVRGTSDPTDAVMQRFKLAYRRYCTPAILAALQGPSNAAARVGKREQLERLLPRPLFQKIEELHRWRQKTGSARHLASDSVTRSEQEAIISFLESEHDH